MVNLSSEAHEASFVPNTSARATRPRIRSLSADDVTIKLVETPKDRRNSVADVSISQLFSSIFCSLSRSSSKSELPPSVKNSLDHPRSSSETSIDSLSSTRHHDDENDEILIDEGAKFTPTSAKLITSPTSILRVKSCRNCMTRNVIKAYDVQQIIAGADPQDGCYSASVDDVLSDNVKILGDDIDSNTASPSSRIFGGQDSKRSISFPPDFDFKDEAKNTHRETSNISSRRVWSKISKLHTEPIVATVPVPRNGLTHWPEPTPTERDIPQGLRLCDLEVKVRALFTKMIPIRFEESIPLLMEFVVYKTFTTPATEENGKSSEYLTLLKVFDKELPNLILCHDCRCFHEVPNLYGQLGRDVTLIKSYMPRYPGQDLTKPGSCLSNCVMGRRGNSSPVIPHIFRFSNLQLAMKRHKSGFASPQYLQPLNSHRIFQTATWKHLWTSKSKIIEDRLVVRTQHWYFLASKVKDVNSSFRDVLVDNPGHSRDDLRVSCHHTSDLRALISYFFEHQRKKKGHLRCDSKLVRRETATSILRCKHCPTAYKIDIGIPTPTKGMQVMVVTAWRDFGRCENCFDPNYISHFEDFNPGKPRVCYNEPDPNNVFFADGIGEPSMLDNVIEKFEGGDDMGWTDKWVRGLQNLQLWDEMRRREKYVRGERPWHEQDVLVLAKRKEAKDRKVPWHPAVSDYELEPLELAHSSIKAIGDDGCQAGEDKEP